MTARTTSGSGAVRAAACAPYHARTRSPSTQRPGRRPTRRCWWSRPTRPRASSPARNGTPTSAATPSRRWARCSTSPERPRAAAATPVSPRPSAPSRRCRRRCRLPADAHRHPRRRQALHGGYGRPRRRRLAENLAPGGGAPSGNGRLLLFVNRGFTTRINELDRKESDALLEFLWSHVEQHLEFQCRVRWEANTLVLWDNRCTQHHASGTTTVLALRRAVSIVGAAPVGV